MTLENFKNLFQYKSELTGYVGVERERFITDERGQVIPKAYDVLSFIEKHGILEWEPTPGIPYPHGLQGKFVPAKPGEFSYELSACQVESRTGPYLLSHISYELLKSESRLNDILRHLKFNASHSEIGPKHMPLDVYPDPTGRYQKITRDMPREVLTAACRIIGTHVHIGMPDHETALRVYNRLCPYFEHLCEMGNGSFGERLAIYRQMAPKYKPTPYESWEDFYGSACKKGFVEDPRKCWTLIRISVHGTIEFRMFGATDNHERIVRWATKCHELCMEAAA